MHQFKTRMSQLAAALVLIGIISSRAQADALYSVSDLGLASPTANVNGQSQQDTGTGYPYLSGQNLVNSNGNYLTSLNASQQAAFEAGSFDLYSHPGTMAYPYGNTPFYNTAAFSYGGGTYDVVGSDQGPDALTNIYMRASNNLGVIVGTAYEQYSQGVPSRLVLFTPDPHTVTSQSPFSPPQTVQSPGYMGIVHTQSDSTYGQFYGTPAGINDHNSIALTEYAYSSGPTALVPHLVMGGGQWTLGGADIALGSLGGANGAAYALNNSNQVVGWSQIASGAAHAFLYSNSTMQDLNSLIPASSGIVLTSAVGIDSAGDIVAYGTDSSGLSHEYLLTPLEAPVPEPASLAIAILAIGTLALRRAAGRQLKTAV
jgi:probable HAF family extracellular repeat protein